MRKERQAKIKVEEAQLDINLAGRLQQAARILGRPIGRPEDISEADAEAIEQYIERERQRNRIVMNRRQLSTSRSKSPPKAKKASPKPLFQMNALNDALKNLGINF